MTETLAGNRLGAAPARPPAPDVEPVAHEWRARLGLGFFTVVPFLMLGVAAWQTWNELLRWHDVLAFALVYLLTTLGVTVGFHRLLTHLTYSINSLCHTFGRRPFRTDDESHNLAWLAVPTLGEAWHNNHHAFPTSAIHGLGKRQIDISGLVIRGLERLGLAWNVVRVPPERQRAKAAPA